MDKETSPRVSSIAAKILDQGFLIPEKHPDVDVLGFNALLADAKTLAGSALSQDETPGQQSSKQRIHNFPPKITITDNGPIMVINVDYGPNTYHASFSTGDDKARDAAIASLVEKICGFSTSQIIIALHELDNDND